MDAPPANCVHLRRALRASGTLRLQPGVDRRDVEGVLAADAPSLDRLAGRSWPLSLVLRAARCARSRRGAPRRGRRPAAATRALGEAAARAGSRARARAPPWSWIAMSTTLWSHVRRRDLDLPRSPQRAQRARARRAARRRAATSSRAWSIAMRASAMRSRLPPRLSERLAERRALSAALDRPARAPPRPAPMQRMQWWMRPGPSRPWAISKARPGPPMSSRAARARR